MSKVFIISIDESRIYPKNDAGWTKYAISETATSLLDNAVKQAVKNNSNLLKTVLKKEFPDSGSDTFNVYLVACLAKTGWYDTNINEKKTKFWEEVVSQILSETKSIGIENTFFIAHDEDFNKQDPDVFASQLPDNEQSKYPNLSKLVNSNHVYLFQHDLTTCIIYSHLRDLLVLDNHDACESIIDIIGETREMLTFFQEVDEPQATEVKNIYTEL